MPTARLAATRHLRGWRRDLRFLQEAMEGHPRAPGVGGRVSQRITSTGEEKPPHRPREDTRPTPAVPVPVLPLVSRSTLPSEAAPGALASLGLSGAHRLTEHTLSTKVCQGTF